MSPWAADNPAVVGEWLNEHDRITSGDYAALTGLTTAGARGSLDRLLDDQLLIRGETAGRNDDNLRRA